MAWHYNRTWAWGKAGVVNFKFQAMLEGVAILDLERARLSGSRDLFWHTETVVGFTAWG